MKALSNRERDTRSGETEPESERRGGGVVLGREGGHHSSRTSQISMSGDRHSPEHNKNYQKNPE